MNFWQILGGTGIFLFGIYLLEDALKHLMSRPFKLFLRRTTTNPLKAILGGTFVTAVLQSSSAVNFMVLAFVSTGVMELRNAMAVIMGANLGTTVTSWMVATVGFSFNIEQFAYPAAGIAGIILFIFQDRKRVATFCRFLLGFSFLFIGLQLMQSATAGDAINTWMSRFSGSGAVVFLLLGFAATTITQSSAATVAITLSLLNRQLIGFEPAMAVVIGSEVGTAMKLVLGSLDGVAVKKRVSAGNLIYNLVTTLGAFIFLHPLAILITDIMQLHNPLYGLVMFQTLMNFFSILIFFPILSPFSKLLEKIFPETQQSVSLYLHNGDISVPDTAIDVLRKESDRFIRSCMTFGGYALEKDAEAETLFSSVPEGKKTIRSFEEGYNFLKELYGELNAYYLELSRQALNNTEIVETNQLMDSVRSAMYAAKCVKDVRHDVRDLVSSARDIKFHFLENMQLQVISLYRALGALPELSDQQKIFDQLSIILNSIQQNYTGNIDLVYRNKETDALTKLEFATLMNFNRAVYTSNKSMLMSWKNILLDNAYAEKFSDIPTYQS